MKCPLLEWNKKREKKTEIVTSWGRWSKNDLFLTFFSGNHEIPKRKIRLMKKRNYKNDTFLVIFCVFLRTGFFVGNGLIDAKNWWKLPIGFFHILINSKSRFLARSNVEKHPFFGPKVNDKKRWVFRWFVKSWLLP